MCFQRIDQKKNPTKYLKIYTTEPQLKHYVSQPDIF